MITNSAIHNGATATVYVLQKGEAIPRRQYEVTHSASVVNGRAKVEIGGRDLIELTNHVDFIELSSKIYYQITALEDNTVVLNLFPMVGM